MSRLSIVLCSVVAVVAFGLSGCGQSGDNSPKPETNGPAAPDHNHADHNHADHDHADHDHGSHGAHGDHEAELAKLSPEDRQLAEKQKVCPVSGEPLGSMGKPYKVTVEERDVFLCCKGCEDAIKKDPAKYLAKLPK